MTTRRLAAYKLPPGQHGLSRDHVAENQRWRLLGAAAELLAETGYRGLTAHKVATRAAVSFRTFYVHFGGLDDCLRAAFEAAAQAVTEAAQASEAIELLAADPALSALFGLELRAAVPEVVPAFASFAEGLAAQLRTRLLLGGALTLMSDRGSVDVTARAEVAGLVESLSGPPGAARDEGPRQPGGVSLRGPVG